MLVYHGKTGKADVKGREETDDCNDNLRDFVIDNKKEFDEASKEKKYCRMQEEGDVLNDQADLESFNAGEKECADSDAFYRRI